MYLTINLRVVRPSSFLSSLIFIRCPHTGNVHHQVSFFLYLLVLRSYDLSSHSLPLAGSLLPCWLITSGLPPYFVSGTILFFFRIRNHLVAILKSDTHVARCPHTGTVPREAPF